MIDTFLFLNFNKAEMLFSQSILSFEDWNEIKRRRKGEECVTEEATHLLGRDEVDAEADVVGWSWEPAVCFQAQCVASLQVLQLGSWQLD